MKGAIGNAFILNMVITFIVIFYMLLIGSMAYSKSYKINKYLHDTLTRLAEKCVSVEGIGRLDPDELSSSCVRWDDEVNDYLSRAGYILSNEDNTCPKGIDGYEILRNTKTGSYDYCLYYKKYDKGIGEKSFTDNRTTYKVISYMKFDFPVIGDFIKVPITSETKAITRYK